MTGDEMEKVIDKIAEKAGVAVEKIQPIAEEVVRQVQDRALFLGCGCAVIAFIFLLFIVLSFVFCRDKDGGIPDNIAPAIAIMGLFFAIFCIATMVNFSDYIAPLASILGV